MGNKLETVKKFLRGLFAGPIIVLVYVWTILSTIFGQDDDDE